MAKLGAERQINGTYGTVWVGNELFADADSFEAKVSVDYEDINMAGDLATHKKMTGWSGEGTLTVKKVYSRGAKLIGSAVKYGKMPTFKIVGRLADPDAYGAERVVIKEVTFSEITLMKFEQKTTMTEELPFSFADFDLVDLIES